MRNRKLSLRIAASLTAAIALSSSGFAQEIEFPVGDEKYVVEDVGSFDLSEISSNVKVYGCNSVAAIDNIVYVADDNCFDGTNYIIHRFDNKEHTTVDITFKPSFTPKCDEFYLMDDDAGHLVVLFRPQQMKFADSNIPCPSVQIAVIDPSSGAIIHEYEASPYPFSFNWDKNIGQPTMTGNAVSGVATYYLPLYDTANKRVEIVALNFEDGAKKASGGLSRWVARRGAATTYSQFAIVAPGISVVEVPSAELTLHAAALGSDATAGVLPDDDSAGCGVAAFTLTDRTMLIHACSDGFNITAWPETTLFPVTSSTDAVDYTLDNVVTVTKIPGNNVEGNTYNIITTESAGIGDEAYIHILTPGRRLVSYRLVPSGNVSSAPLNVVSENDWSFIDARTISFNEMQSTVTISDLQGRVIYSAHNLQTLDATLLAPGIYLLRTPTSTSKLHLK